MIHPLRIPVYDAIIEAGFRVLSANPKASLAEIALAAGVGRATLHRHFSGREDLLRVLALQALHELDEVADQAAKGAWSHKDALRKIMRAIIPLGERQWFLSQGMVQNYPEVQAALRVQNAEFQTLIEKAGAEGLFPASCPVQWVMQSYDMLVYGAWQMVRDGHATPSQATNLAWKTLTGGLKKAVL